MSIIRKSSIMAWTLKEYVSGSQREIISESIFSWNLKTLSWTQREDKQLGCKKELDIWEYSRHR